MAFLKLNNITVPVMECSATHGVIGASSRALRGDYLSDVRNIKRTWRVRCSPMTQQAASVLVGMLNGRGQLFTYDEDSYSESGFAANSEQYTRFTDEPNDIMQNTAADGNAAKILYTPPSTAGNVCARSGCIGAFTDSTNLCPEHIRDCEGTGANLPSAIFSALSGATLADDTTYFYQGGQSLKVTTTAGLQRGCTMPAGQRAAVTGGNVYTGHLKLLVQSGDGNLTIRLIDDQSTAQTVAISGLTTNTWYWIMVPSLTTDALATTARLEVYDSAAGDATIFNIDELQIEETSFPTCWIDGARGGNYFLRYPTSILDNADSFSVAAWTIGSSRAESGVDDGPIFGLYESSAVNRVYIEINSGNQKMTAAGLTDTGAAWSVLAANAHVFGQLKHYAFVYDGNSNTAYMYTNGALDNSTTPTGGIKLDNLADGIGIGVDPLAGFQRALNGHLDDVLVLPYPLTSDAVSGLYASGTPPAIGYPRLIATGDFAHDTSVTVRGANVRQTNIHLNGVNNYKSVEFAMEEV